MKLISLFFLLFIASCGEIDEKGSITSSDDKYNIVYDVNKNTSDVKKRDCLFLKVFDNNGQYLSTFQTGVSVFSNWGIAWFKKTDTLIIFSSDIGTHLYKIDCNKLTDLKTTPKLIKSADSLESALRSSH